MNLPNIAFTARETSSGNVCIAGSLCAGFSSTWRVNRRKDQLRSFYSLFSFELQHRRFGELIQRIWVRRSETVWSKFKSLASSSLQTAEAGAGYMTDVPNVQYIARASRWKNASEAIVHSLCVAMTKKRAQSLLTSLARQQQYSIVRKGMTPNGILLGR